MSIIEKSINKGSTSIRNFITINDKVTGDPVSNIGGGQVDCAVWHAGLSAASSVALSNGNAFGTFVEKSWQVCDNLEMPGVYQIDLPNILFNNTGTYSIAFFKPTGQLSFTYRYDLVPPAVNVYQVTSTGVNGLTLEQSMRVLMSHNFGYNQRSDAGGGITQLTFKDFAATGTTRIVYSIDVSGDRTGLATITG